MYYVVSEHPMIVPMGGPGGVGVRDTSYVWVTPFKTKKEAQKRADKILDQGRTIKIEVLTKKEYEAE